MIPRMALGCLLGLFALPVGAVPWQGFTALCLSPDGQTFATGGREGEVLWGETSTGEILGRWVAPTAKPLVALAFDPTGKHLAAVALDGAFGEADLGTGEWKVSDRVPEGWKPLSQAVARWIQNSPLYGGVQASSGDRQATGSPEGVITVSSLSDGRLLATWTGHEAAVTGLAWTNGGAYLLSCSYDGVLALWDPATGKLLGRL